MNQLESDSVLPNGIELVPYLRMKQEGMTENENRIVEWLLKPGNLSYVSTVKDVAGALAIPEATVIKVSKLLGFSDFRNLRGVLEGYFSQSEQVLLSELASDKAPQGAMNKVFSITLRTIVEGQPAVSADRIHRAARFFCQARQRDLYDVEGSNAICADVQHRPLHIGVRYQAYPDTHIVMMSAPLLREGDMILVVAHPRQTSDVKAAVELAKKNGAKIICVTHSYHSSIAKLADYITYSPVLETPLLGHNVLARIL